ncbi:MAG: hypothetical protein AB7N91_10640 [Candidatus Tectimicrobiota bacterium]
MWLHTPPKRPKPKVPDDVTAAVTAQAEQLLAEWCPRYITAPPPGYQFNYIVELYGKWFRSYFYLCAKYACPGPTALSPFFEARFARLEYVGDRKFNLAFMRHTGQWVELEQDVTIDQCFQSLRKDSFYQPA